MALDRGRLLGIFREELGDRRRELERGLLALEEGPGAARRAELIAELFRAAHSLKGAAHSAGVSEIADVSHRLEDLFAQWRESGAAPDAPQLRGAFAAIDQIDELAEAVGPHGDATGAGRGPGSSTERRGDVPGRPAPHRRGRGPDPLRARVASQDLDDAVAAAGQLHLGVASVAQLATSANDLVSEVQRLRRDWHALLAVSQSGPLPAHARVLMGRVDTQLRDLATLAGEAERRTTDRGRQVARSAGELQRAVQRLGLVRFDEVCAGLDRVVRDVATKSGKRARLDVDAGTLELDRTVADVLRDPLVHLVRNAVDHGLEPAATRVHVGKPPDGRVAVAAALVEGELVVTVSDDGAGIDAAAVSRQAAQRGLQVPPSSEDVLPLLFEPGWSTGTGTTDVSGRGVGLDVVRTAVEAVGGSVELETAPGSGTTVRMRLPLTLSSMRAVVVRAAGEDIALPATAVERARRVPRDDVTRSAARPMIVDEGRSVALVDLAALLGFGQADVDPEGDLPVICVRTADGEAALVVDAVEGEQEVWVRPLPGRLRGLRGLLGGVVLGDGRCVLLLSPAAWVRDVRHHAPAPSVQPEATQSVKPRVLLAEDTATTRMLEQSILEAAGYDVVVAVDGDEAWRLLQQHGADLIVTDIDMPNMDGFELCRRIRSSPRWASLPVVLVTSLADERDRARGLAVGADAYFVKSSFDPTSLVDTIARLL